MGPLMTVDFSMRELSRAKQCMMLGLAQNPLSRTDHALSTLALIAAKSRFSRSKPQARSADRHARQPADPARYLSVAARTMLVRLLTGKDTKVADAIARAVLRAIRHSGLRLHPFDYSRLENFIAQFAGELGPEERQWLKAVRPNRIQPGSTYDDEPVSEETLAQAGKAQKLAFLKDLRRNDPAKARSLIEQLLPAETANVRTELVGLIGINLDDADKTFLESLATDKAQSVRERAAMLLARLPGTSAYRKKLDQLKDRIEAKKAGLLRRRTMFSLRSTPKPNAAFDPLHTMNENRELFEGVKVGDIAAVLNVDLDELIVGSAESADLGHLLLRCALLEGREAELNAFSPSFTGDVSHQTVFLLADLLPRLLGDGRKTLLDLAFSPVTWSLLPSTSVFVQLYAALGEPLPHEIATALMQSSPWREAMRHDGDEMHLRRLEEIAPLIPRSLSEQFIAESEPHSRRAALYHRFLLTLPEPADMRT
jgi:hypothetical protein